MSTSVATSRKMESLMNKERVVEHSSSYFDIMHLLTTPKYTDLERANQAVQGGFVIPPELINIVRKAYLDGKLEGTKMYMISQDVYDPDMKPLPAPFNDFETNLKYSREYPRKIRKGVNLEAIPQGVLRAPIKFIPMTRDELKHAYKIAMGDNYNINVVEDYFGPKRKRIIHPVVKKMIIPPFKPKSNTDQALQEVQIFNENKKLLIKERDKRLKEEKKTLEEIRRRRIQAELRYKEKLDNETMAIKQKVKEARHSRETTSSSITRKAETKIVQPSTSQQLSPTPFSLSGYEKITSEVLQTLKAVTDLTSKKMKPAYKGQIQSLQDPIKKKKEKITFDADFNMSVVLPENLVPPSSWDSQIKDLRERQTQKIETEGGKYVPTTHIGSKAPSQAKSLNSEPCASSSLKEIVEPKTELIQQVEVQPENDPVQVAQPQDQNKINEQNLLTNIELDSMIQTLEVAASEPRSRPSPLEEDNMSIHTSHNQWIEIADTAALEVASRASSLSLGSSSSKGVSSQNSPLLRPKMTKRPVSTVVTKKAHASNDKPSTSHGMFEPTADLVKSRLYGPLAGKASSDAASVHSRETQSTGAKVRKIAAFSKKRKEPKKVDTGDDTTSEFSSLGWSETYNVGDEARLLRAQSETVTNSSENTFDLMPEVKEELEDPEDLIPPPMVAPSLRRSKRSLLPDERDGCPRPKKLKQPEQPKRAHLAVEQDAEPPAPLCESAIASPRQKHNFAVIRIVYGAMNKLFSTDPQNFSKFILTLKNDDKQSMRIYSQDVNVRDRKSEFSQELIDLCAAYDVNDEYSNPNYRTYSCLVEEFLHRCPRNRVVLPDGATTNDFVKLIEMPVDWCAYFKNPHWSVDDKIVLKFACEGTISMMIESVLKMAIMSNVEKMPQQYIQRRFSMLVNGWRVFMFKAFPQVIIKVAQRSDQKCSPTLIPQLEAVCSSVSNDIDLVEKSLGKSADHILAHVLKESRLTQEEYEILVENHVNNPENSHMISCSTDECAKIVSKTAKCSAKVMELHDKLFHGTGAECSVCYSDFPSTAIFKYHNICAHYGIPKPEE